MTDIIHLPLNRLAAWSGNVRKTAAAKEGLAERPAKDGRYEIGAGGRRHAALHLLVKNGDIPADHPVPCHDHGEIRLAENHAREDMHPPMNSKPSARWLTTANPQPKSPPASA